MINHFRTLLLNIPGSSTVPTSWPGEELIPAEFAGFTLTGGLQTIYRIVFGLSPDRAYKNYRLREILAILHTSDMAGFVTAYDSRITYWPPRNNSLFNMTIAGATITPAPGTTAQLYFLGPQNLAAIDENIYYSYTITVTDASHVTITRNYSQDSNVLPNIFSYTTTSGLSNPVTLPGTPYQIQFVPTVGSSWTLVWLATPIKTLMNVYNDLITGLTSDLQTTLFGLPNDPIYGVFNQLWNQSPSPPYRIGGVVLALGQRLNDLYV